MIKSITICSVVSLMALGIDAKLRGNFEDMRKELKSDLTRGYHGRTLNELGLDLSAWKSSRQLQENELEFFSVSLLKKR